MFIITSQDKLVSPYHASSAELELLISVAPGTLRADVITHYTTAPQLINYMSPECSMPLRTELCILFIVNYNSFYAFSYKDVSQKKLIFLIFLLWQIETRFKLFDLCLVDIISVTIDSDRSE